MRKITATGILVLALTACAGPGTLGNHATHMSPENQNQLANEAVNQLVTIYPPARIQLELKQATKDAFGTALVNRLRQSGYAVLESGLKESGPPFTQDSAEPAMPAMPARPTMQPESGVPQTASQIVPLTYLIDQAGTTNLYRMTLTIGTQSLTRPYQQESGKILAAGYWVRKE